MKISETFSGTYFKAADFPTPRSLVIESVTMVTFEEGPKPAIRFHGEKQQLVLNRTNGYVLANAFGDDTEVWRGKHIQVLALPTFFQGKPVKGLCVQPLSQAGDAQGQVSVIADQTSPTAASPAPATPPSPASQSGAQLLSPSPMPSSQPLTPQSDRPVQAPKIDYDA